MGPAGGSGAIDARRWTTRPGDRLTRAQLAALYGGNPRAGRIMASDATPNVLLFSDPPERGRPWESLDGPTQEGAWSFTGRGPAGDQDPAANRALLDHAAQGRTLRLFVSEGYAPGTHAEIHRYVGEFRVDPDLPYRRERAVDREGALRWILVFRLLPVQRARARAAPRAEAEAAPGVAAEAPPEVPQPAVRRSCNIVAHLDDDLLFINPALQFDIDRGWGVRTIVLTAGDAGLDEDYWLERENGLRAAYAHMAGVRDAWSSTDAGVPGRDITVDSLEDAPGVQLVFLRLPDGNIDGTGFAATGNVSLRRLWLGTTPSLTTVDDGETYTADELVSTLAALLSGFDPALVRTLDFVGSFDDGDHSDHHASAYFALTAARAAGINRRVGHRGYPMAPWAQNVGPTQVARKLATFLIYAAHDPQVPVDAPELGVYGPWLARRYTCGTGNIAGLASVTASSADASTGQVAARAIDGWAPGEPDAAHEWATVGGGAGSWLRLEWQTPHTVRRVALYGRDNGDDLILAGRVVLPDGTEFPTGAVEGFEPTTVEVDDVEVTSLTFVVDEAGPATENIGLAEIEVHEANLAPDAVATASSENVATGQVAASAVDGVAAGYPQQPQHEWVTQGGGVGAWLQLSWAAPRLVRRVVLHDRPNADDHVSAVRLSFSDGSSVDVPDMPDDTTAIDVAPRLVTWLILTVTGVSPTTKNIGLAEVRVEGS